MGFSHIPLSGIPDGMVLDQALMETPLRVLELESRYGFKFTLTTDDLSSVAVCLIKSDSGAFYLVTAREELLEQKTAIWTSRADISFEEFVQQRAEDFVFSTNFDVSDLQQIWEFVLIEGSRPA